MIISDLRDNMDNILPKIRNQENFEELRIFLFLSQGKYSYLEKEYFRFAVKLSRPEKSIICRRRKFLIHYFIFTFFFNLAIGIDFLWRKLHVICGGLGN